MTNRTERDEAIEAAAVALLALSDSRVWGHGEASAAFAVLRTALSLPVAPVPVAASERDEKMRAEVATLINDAKNHADSRASQTMMPGLRHLSALLALPTPAPAVEPREWGALRALAAADERWQSALVAETEADRRRREECGRGPDEGWGEHDAPPAWMAWRRARTERIDAEHAWTLAIRACVLVARPAPLAAHPPAEEASKVVTKNPRLGGPHPYEGEDTTCERCGFSPGSAVHDPPASPSVEAAERGMRARDRALVTKVLMHAGEKVTGDRMLAWMDALIDACPLNAKDGAQ